MSQIIYKYIIDPEHPVLEIPPLIGQDGRRRSLKEQILHVDKQHENMALWAMVTPESPPRPVNCQICMTGVPCESVDPADHVATVLLIDGQYVFHIFLREVADSALSV